MIYTILILTFFSIILLCKNYKSKYSWYFGLMIIGLDMAFCAITFYVAKLGNYRYPDSIFLVPDYKVYLFLTSIKIDYYNISRILNIGIAVFSYAVPICIYQYISTNDRNPVRRKAVNLSLIAIFPVLYICFYDPETSYKIYVMVTSGNNSILAGGFFSIIIKAFDIVNNLMIVIYLFYPVFLLYRHYGRTIVWLKKKQMVSLMVSLVFLDTLFFIVFVIGPFKELYIFSFEPNLLKFFGEVNIPIYFYNIMPVIMLAAIQIILVILIKYGGIDTSSFLRKIIINRNIRKMNENLRGAFHSFKNTLFMLKILSEQAEAEYGSPKGLEAVRRMKQASETSLNGVTKMLNSLKEISLKPSRSNVAGLIDEALKDIYVGDGTKVEKLYIDREACAYLDPYHFIEAVAHIVQNSVEAIQSAKISEGLITIELNSENEWVVIKITDNGSGISPGIIKKIFNPLYSTKSKHNNWGIGLSYVFRVIKCHLGFIDVKSTEGEYTTFQVIIPRVKEGAGIGQN